MAFGAVDAHGLCFVDEIIHLSGQPFGARTTQVNFSWCFEIDRADLSGGMR